jgi:hypothetical protein
MLTVLAVVIIFFVGEGYKIGNKQFKNKTVNYPTIKLDDSVLNSVHSLIEDKNKLNQSKNILIYNNNSLSDVNTKYLDSIKKINEILNLSKNHLIKNNKMITEENLKNKVKIDSLNNLIHNLNEKLDILTKKYNSLKDSSNVKVVVDTIYLEKSKPKKRFKRL